MLLVISSNTLDIFLWEPEKKKTVPNVAGTEKTSSEI